MFTFIVLVIVVILYISLNNRLSAIEKELTHKTQNNPASTVASAAPSYQQPQVVASTTQTTPLVAPIPTPISSAVPVPQPPVQQFVAPSSGFDEVTGGKILAILGIAAVFIGLAFFLKYAFDTNLITVTGRVILGYAVGVLAIVLGMSLRDRYSEYADTLTGGGFAVLFLTTFASYGFYHLISNSAATVLLLIITAITVAISVSLKSQPLAALAFAGAFLTPLIMSLYKIDPMSYFGYILVINLGTASIAYWYKWTKLNLVGVICTALLTMAWYSTAMNMMTDKMMVFLFISLYFGMYLISGLLHHVLRKQISDESDGLFTALNGITYAGIGYALLVPLYPNAMGIFMLVIAIIYFFAALISFETNPTDRTMNIILPAVATLFLTIAIPLHFNGNFIPLAWIMEAVILFIVDYSVRGKNLYVYGTIVYVVGLVNLVVFHLGIHTRDTTFTPIMNERFFLFAFATIAGYVMAYIASLESRREQNDQADVTKVIMAILGQLTGLLLVTTEINAYYESNRTLGVSIENAKNTAITIAWALYATALTAIGFAGRYKTIRLGGLLLFIVTAFKIFADLWSFGPLYRIVASIAFGVIALGASFAYSKFKDRLFVDGK